MSSSLLSPYIPPEWAFPPPPAVVTESSEDKNVTSKEWVLEEIKGGSILSRHSLQNVAITLFGRLEFHPLPPNSQFIHTAHESCSKLHARIASDRNGYVWLRDLGSVHGTTVNRRPLPTRSIGRQENGTGDGSRGVRIFPGDIIQFGASSRCFVLDGPSLDSSSHSLTKNPNVQKLDNVTVDTHSEAFDMRKREEEKKKKEEEGISWGIRDYDLQNQDDDETDTTPSQQNTFMQQGSCQVDDATSIPEKHRKLYDKIVNKKYKLANIQQETEKIQRKQTVMNDLTEGQIAQITKNSTKEKELMQEIEELEYTLFSHLHGSEQKHATGSTFKKRRRGTSTQDYGDEEEEEEDDCRFYDRTRERENNQSQSNGQEVAETEDSFKRNWLRLHSLLQRKQIETQRIIQIIQGIEKDIINSSENTEDLFFHQNDLTLAKDRFRRAKESEDDVEKELSSIETVLRCVNKNYIFDRNAGFVGDKTMDKISNQNRSIVETSSNLSQKFGGIENFEIQVDHADPMANKCTLNPNTENGIPSPVMNELSSTQLSDRVENRDHDKWGNKEISTVKTIATPSDSSVGVPILPGAPIVRKMKGPPKPTPGGSTLATISAAFSSNGSNRDPSSNNKMNRNDDKGSEGRKDSGYLHDHDKKRDEWIAPEGQDGSGKTKLNEKFLGRY